MSLYEIVKKHKNTPTAEVVAKTPEQLRDIIWAHKGQFFSVTFTKKCGADRTIVGQVGYKNGYDGENTVWHKEQYVTVVEKGEGDIPGKPRFRNVNTETIKRLAIGGRVLYIKE